MTSEEWSALAADAGSVRDTLAALMWWVRGAGVSSPTTHQAEEVARVQRIVEGAQQAAGVVANRLEDVERRLREAESGKGAK